MKRGPISRARVSAGLVEQLAAAYGLPRIDETADLGGSSNLNLLVTVGADRYVARVYRPWTTRQRVFDIQTARAALRAGGVPSPAPLETADGETVIAIDGRVVEVEPFVDHAANMDTWERLTAGLPVLGRVHDCLRPLDLSPDGRDAPAANHIGREDAPAWTAGGTAEIRRWPPSAALRLADDADELAHLLARHEAPVTNDGPGQIVHGDFWDNNVLFRRDEIVAVTDLDFMGERPRIDDLALTLYYANSTFTDDQRSDRRIHQLAHLAAAYQSGLSEPLAADEVAAIPLALARTPLAFVGMIAEVDSEREARTLASELVADVAWALDIARAPERWQSAFAAELGRRLG